MGNAREWVLNWFLKNTDVEQKEIIDKQRENYFELGWLDSLNFINFISDIEEEFNIELSNDDFQDRSFATIEGVATIIEKRIGQ